MDKDKKLKVHVARKIYLGRYETKTVGLELEVNTKEEDYKSRFLKLYSQISDMIEKLVLREKEQMLKNAKKQAQKENKRKKKKYKELLDKLNKS